MGLEYLRLEKRLKELQKEFGGINPKLVSIREKISKEKREIQIKINKLKNTKTWKD